MLLLSMISASALAGTAVNDPSDDAKLVWNCQTSAAKDALQIYNIPHSRFRGVGYSASYVLVINDQQVCSAVQTGRCPPAALTSDSGFWYGKVKSYSGQDMSELWTTFGETALAFFSDKGGMKLAELFVRDGSVDPSGKNNYFFRPGDCRKF